MRFLKSLIIIFLLVSNVQAQLIHFIFIQTEDQQPFYIRLNGKLMSSSLSGYLIIPKLTDGTYSLTLGFPKNEWPSQNVDIKISNKDEGFLLKNFNEKGWGLFNLQSMVITMATDAQPTDGMVIKNKTDAFSNTLAEVTNTPSIAQQLVQSPLPESPLVDSINILEREKASEPVAAMDSVSPVIEILTSKVSDTITAKITDITIPVAALQSQIKQEFSLMDSSGRSMIYVATDDVESDTIRLFIPYETNHIAHLNNEEAAGKNQMPSTESGTEAVKDSSIEGKVENNPASIPQIETLPVKDSAALLGKAGKSTDLTEAGRHATITLINPACKSAASESDFLKLRKKMAAAGDDEAMLEVLKKGFKSKCYTSEQVKNLSLLFLNDEGKYNCYDAAYGHVLDIEQFKDLQAQLSDEYYINRFKAMLR